MADEVKIEMFGDVFFRRRLRKLAFRAMDMRPVMHDIGDDMLQIIEEQFATEGARSGHKWAELRFDTISRRGSAHPILIDSGDMFLEVTDPANKRVTHDSVTINFPMAQKTKLESAQYGFHTRDGGGRESSVEFIEPRRVIDFTDLDHVNFRRKITDFLVSGDRTQ